MAIAQNKMLIDGGGALEGQVSPALSALDTASSEYKKILSSFMDMESVELDALEAETAAEIAMAEAIGFEAEAIGLEADAAAAEAEAAADEGDKQVVAAEGEFNKAFFADPNATISGLSTSLQKVAGAGLFGGNAAYTSLYSMLSSIGVQGLVDVIERIREQYPEISSEEMLMMLKYDKRYNEPYLARFSGNKARIAQGLAPLDDTTYLSNEAAYKKIFEAYGLKQFVNTDKYANFIGSNISPDEVANRVQLVYDRVNTGMSEVKKALLQFYPELTTQDLMAYALDPVNQLPALNRKIQAAEIGGAALAQGLSTSLQARTLTGTEGAGFTNVTRQTMGVEEMMAQGADLESAKKASRFVASTLPTAEKLSSIYSQGYEQYGQLQAEEEAYKGLASAERARLRLTAREQAEFSGRAGTSSRALRKPGTAGIL